TRVACSLPASVAGQQRVGLLVGRRAVARLRATEAQRLPHQDRERTSIGRLSWDRSLGTSSAIRDLAHRVIYPITRYQITQLSKSQFRQFAVSHRDILGPQRSRAMEQTHPRLPAEAIELYNQYIHGEIERRDFLNGMSRVAVVGLTASAMIDLLMPNYAVGQQVSKTDERIKTSYVTIPSPQGNGTIKAYLVRPFSADSRE